MLKMTNVWVTEQRRSLRFKKKILLPVFYFFSYLLFSCPWSDICSVDIFGIYFCGLYQLGKLHFLDKSSLNFSSHSFWKSLCSLHKPQCRNVFRCHDLHKQGNLPILVLKPRMKALGCVEKTRFRRTLWIKKQNVIYNTFLYCVRDAWNHRATLYQTHNLYN